MCTFGAGNEATYRELHVASLGIQNTQGTPTYLSYQMVDSDAPGCFKMYKTVVLQLLLHKPALVLCLSL